jgi:hypothetical protein
MIMFETGIKIGRGLMRHKLVIGLAGFLIVAFFMVPVPAHSQAWAGILDQTRATNWSYAGVQGGIPTYTHVCQTVNPSGDATGAKDVTSINKALSTCAASASVSSPQVVFLTAGTFYAKASIGPPDGSKYLVLRGAGASTTVIKWVGTSSACGQSGGVDLCFEGNSHSGETGITGWLGTNNRGTYAQGDTVLDLSSTTGLAAGMILILTQRNDSMGLCPQSGGTGNCSGHVGLTNNGNGTVTAMTSAPYPDIVNGTKVYIGTKLNHTYDSCGGYQSGGTPVTASSVSTTATNTIFTYPPNFTLGTIGPHCDPAYASVDTGGVYTSDINGGTIDGGATSGTVCPDVRSGNTCLPGEISLRSQVEAHLITAVCTRAGTPNAACLTPNEVVIDGQVMAPNWRSGQRPSVWWMGSGASAIADHVGVESLTVDATNDGTPTHPYASIKFKSVSNFWIKNVRSMNAYAKNIDTSNVTRGSIVDSYIYGGQHVGPNSYGLDLDINTSYVLVENNIFQELGAATIVEQAYGNVISYNYYISFRQPLDRGQNGMLNTNHGFSGAQLAEGNDTNECLADNIHGTSWGITFFRNRCRGQDTPARSLFLLAASDQAFQRGENYIGNILGTSPYETQYTTTVIPPLPGAAIYALNISGYVEGNAPARTGLRDPIVTSTLLRWGNYDVVTAATRWCATGREANCGGTSEIPTNRVPYINGNLLPASHTLPASFYLSAQPQFWTMASGYGRTPPWPPIGPDVTGGTAPDGVGGFSYPIPAQLCYQNAPVDPSYQKTYSVIGASWSSGTATLATSRNALAVNDTISVSGVNPSGYNGTWQVKSITSNTVSFAVPSNLPGGLSGGTVTSRNILLFDAAKCYAAYGGSTPAPPSKLPVQEPK